MPKEIPMPACIEDVIFVIYKVVRLRVFFWIGLFEQFLPPVVHSVWHNVTGIVAHDSIFTDGLAGTEARAGMLGCEAFNYVIRVHRKASNFVLTIIINTVVLVA